MNNKKHSLRLANGIQLNYYLWGNGPEHLLAFHGFGQDGLLFQPLAEVLKNQYTIYSFDLFFHGSSIWPHREQPLTKDRWREIIKSFLAEKGTDRFSMAGYSLGGRFALVTAQLFATKIDRLILIAPDGIKTSFWYSFATYPIFIRRLFKYTIKHPGIFFGMNKLLGALGIVNQGLLKFTRTQMDTPEKRYRVYYTWMVFRKMIYKPRAAAQTINHHQIPTQVFLGRYDKVITPGSLKPWLLQLEAGESHLLESGHTDLVRATAKVLADDHLK